MKLSRFFKMDQNKLFTKNVELQELVTKKMKVFWNFFIVIRINCIQLRGGQVFVESETGKGTQVQFNLPYLFELT